MQKCLSCGRDKEFPRDQFCQVCEGRHTARNYADNVRLEVLTRARQLNLPPTAPRMLRYKIASISRWRNTALNMIDTAKYNKFYQAFMAELTAQTSIIEGVAQNG